MSWGLVAVGAGTAAAGYFGSKGRDGGGGFEALPQSPSQQRMEKLLEQIATQKVTFKPRQIAPITEAEKAIADIPGLNEAIEKIRRIMTGPVETLPGIEGLYGKTRELGADLLGSTKRGLVMSGHLPSESSRGEKIMGRTWQDIQNEFITAAYPFYAQGLEAKLNAPTTLANLATQRATMKGAVGETERGIEQSILDAILEATRKTKMAPYNINAPIAQGIYGSTQYGYKEQFLQPSTFSEMAPIIGQLAAAAILKKSPTASAWSQTMAAKTNPWLTE